ncbi:MAG: acyl-CoA thioester hydrolase/BAAT C-terminal domain-containing protein, partial [Wohlfahrtiimonas sp.]
VFHVGLNGVKYYLSVVSLSLMPVWANGEFTVFNDEIREDQSAITYYLKKAPDAKNLAVILQGSDCNSIYNNQFVLDNFADLTPETDTLLVEKSGITQSLPYINGERQDCPKAYLDHDSMAQRVQDYVQILDQLKNSYEKIYLIGGSEGAVVAVLLSTQLDYVDATIAMNGGGQYFLDDIYFFIEKSVPTEHHEEAKASFKESLQAVLDGQSDDYLSEHGKKWWQSATKIDFQQTLENSQNKILVIQTLNDDNVNWQGAVDMSKRIQSNKVEFHFIDGQNHYFENEKGERSAEALRIIIQNWLAKVL